MKSCEVGYSAKAMEKHAYLWAYGHSVFAAAAYVLAPEIFSHDQAATSQVTEDFMTTLEKISILQKVRL